MRYMVVCICVLTAACVSNEVITKTDHRGGAAAASHTHSVCVMPGALPSGVQYVVVGQISATKKTYGTVDELGAAVANEARHIGADAVMNYSASQRFKGPLPWRVTSPTSVGTAVKVLHGTLDCAQVNGLSL